MNNVTVILCWSAAEAARYLELYKSYEHANSSAIRGTESKGYAEKMVDFVTVPRSINKTDAVSLVSAFGSIKNAVNARPEEVAVVGGWGEKKVRRWCAVVDEPFRARKATKKGAAESAGGSSVLDRALPLSMVPLRSMPSAGEDATPGLVSQNSRAGEKSQRAQGSRSPGSTEQFHLWDPDDDDDDDEEAMIAVAEEEERRQAAEKRKAQARKDEELSGGIAAALAKLRQN